MYLIHRDEPGKAWRRSPISAQGTAILSGGAGAAVLRDGPDPHALAMVVPFEFQGRPAAALLARPSGLDVAVGGRQPLPLSVLEERSEILIDGATLYFTARRPLEVSTHHGEGECGVCREPVDGCRVIVCSGCGALAHEGALAEDGERACFTHRGGCPGCERPRDDFSWMPEEGAACSI